MSDEIANLFAKMFIQRRDVKAVQRALPDGKIIYMPDGRREDQKYVEYFPWSRKALNDHISGAKTYGHYLLDPSDTVKLFALDIDLEEVGWLPTDEEFTNFEQAVPRITWRNRAMTNQRNFMKLQFKTLAHMLMRAIESELDLPTAAAYTGGKGIHVYGFTGPVSASDARDGALIVLDSLDRFKPKRGENFFVDSESDHLLGFQNMSIELFPKQSTLESKDLGNLMRLPLGKNLKNPNDPTFFIDMTSPMAVMRPVDPVKALTQHWLS